MKRVAVVCLYVRAFAVLAWERSGGADGCFKAMTLMMTLSDLRKCSLYKNVGRFVGANAGV